MAEQNTNILTLYSFVQLRIYAVDACVSSKFRDLVRPSAAKNKISCVYLKASV